MRPDEARRITGTHLLLDGPGAALDVAVDPGDDVEAWVARVSRQLDEGARALGLTLGPLVRREHTRGISLACRAPDDALYAAAELLDWAAAGLHPDALAAAIAARDDEANPRLRALLDRAEGAVLVDEDGLTVGLGEHATTWPLDALPEPATVGPGLRIPTIYVTGTNGKTTTTRMLARIAAAAGHTPGFTSSDGVTVGAETVEKGDWTGPGAARLVLRHPQVTLAVLETARGGLMRRGLVLDGVDAAVVTNVSSDHLGEWGIGTVAEMAAAKLVVARGVKPGGSLVVHGRNAPLAEALPTLGALRPDLRILRFADAVGADVAGLDAWADATTLWVRTKTGAVPLLPLASVPATLRGAARHNVENALAATLGALALGLSLEAVRAGLMTFRTSVRDSAGRLNVFRMPGGGTAIVDFAHNPDGVRRLSELAQRFEASERRLVVGQAGDRTDADLRDLGAAAAAMGADAVHLKDMPKYLRGRAPGEIPARIRAALEGAGQPAATIHDHLTEADAVAAAVAGLPAGGLAVLTVHADLEGTVGLLRGLGAVEA